MAASTRAPFIILRADGDAQIGLGHAMRTLALARILRNVSQIALATRMMPDVLKDLYRSSGAEVVDLSSVEAANEPEFICQQLPGASTIIIDGYGFNSEYQFSMRAAGLKVVVVDDMGGNNFSADVIINHSPGVHPQDYRVSEQTHLCLGLDYTILQPVFMNHDKTGEEPIPGQVFLNMGGADPQNITARVLEILERIPVISGIDVVVGGVNQHFEELEKMANQSLGLIQLHYDLAPEQMADLMRSTQIGICTASTVAIEASYCHLPLIVGWAVDNQRFIYSGLLDKNMAVGVGCLTNLNVDKFALQVEQLMDDNCLQNKLRKAQSDLLSGQSARNLRRCILNTNQ